MKKIMCVIGTRPEAIKMAPVIIALQKCSWAKVKILATAQHREMMDQVLEIFDIKPDYDLNTMRENQTLTNLTASLLVGVGKILDEEKPDIVLVQGDTTTVMAVTLASFYRHIPVGHVEAGLRSGNKYNPFPEEVNRIITGHLAQWHFAPTEKAKANLLHEGLSADNIYVTGNTVIDALFYVLNKNIKTKINFPENTRGILVTTHRRENFGKNLQNICQAIKILANKYDDCYFIFPVHPNPNVQTVVKQNLSGIKNICLCQPLDYVSIINVMKQCTLVISDSGGIQEEAPALGKPVMVLRESTERQEAIEAGVAKLIGTDRDTIVEEVSHLLDDKSAYSNMAHKVSPYGDGHAARRICDILAGDRK